MKKYRSLFDKVTSAEELFSAWDRFKNGKRNKLDVMRFEKDLEKQIFALQRTLENGTYRHEGYIEFRITDPKLREISKASVRDRILHHALFTALNPVFEPTFIANSFSCRVGKGSHKGVEVVAKMLRSESRNNTRPCFVLKCDVRRFFASVEHEVLLGILKQRISDQKMIDLLKEVIKSYPKSGTTERERERE
jgi:RNA-directed DNA polymerase